MNDAEVMQEYLDKKNVLSKTAVNFINQLCDNGSFVELNMFASGNDGNAITCGYARISDRVVFVYAFNHDVNQGALSQRDICVVLDIFSKAKTTGTPIIGILHCDGLKLELNLQAADGWGRLIKAAADCSGIVPHIMYVEGAALGLVGMYSQCADILLLDKNATLGIGTSQRCMVTADECASCGTASILTDKSKVAADIRRVLSYLPDNCNVPHEGLASVDDINRKCDDLSIGCSAQQIINSVFDFGSYLPLYDNFATDVLAGFAFIGGISVAVLSSNSNLISANGSRKIVRVLKIADAYGLPVITLCDTEGFKVCKECEAQGILAHDSSMAMAFSSLSTPLITVITGQAVGSAYVAMGSKSLGADIVYAWVGSEIGLISAEAAVVISQEDKLAGCQDPISYRKQLIQEYKDKHMNVYVAAQGGLVDQPILPRDTRAYIAAAVDCMINKSIISNKAILPV